MTSVEVIDSLPYGIALFDADGRCLRANKQLQSMLSPTATLAGKSIPELAEACFGREYAEQARTDFEGVLADGEARIAREWRCTSGRSRYDCTWQRCNAAPAAAVLGVVDVTPHVERRRVLEERAQLSAGLTALETSLGYTTDFDDILAALTADSPDIFLCTAAATLTRAGESWVVRHVRGLPRLLVGRSFSTSELPQAEEAMRRRGPAAGTTSGDTAWAAGDHLCVPLAATGEIAALLLLVGREEVFSSAALYYADKLSTVASFALENARLQGAERETREALQTALLGVVRDVPGIALGHLYRSASRRAAVGGDFYEVFVIDESRVGVLMGDVSGKGLEAASLAALVKTTVKIHAHDSGSPGAVMAKTNEVLVGECEPARFVTAFYGVLETSRGDFCYCIAGHPPAVLHRANGMTVLLKEASPILGAYPGLPYEDHRTRLENRDVLLLYTDGVTEARHAGDQFGEERLVKVVAQLDHVDARDLPEIVFEEVFAHVRGDLQDDMAILALSPTGVGGDQPQQRLPL